jgi:hypothetical protein
MHIFSGSCPRSEKMDCCIRVRMGPVSREDWCRGRGQEHGFSIGYSL